LHTIAKHPFTLYKPIQLKHALVEKALFVNPNTFL